MVLLEPDKFLAEFEKCLTASKAKKKGSVCMTMKRWDGRTKPKPRKSAESSPAPVETKKNYQCLVRVVYDKRKLSCHVSQQNLSKFQLAFSALLRSGLSSLGKTPGQSQPPALSAASAVSSASEASAVVVSTSKPSPLTTTVKAKSLPAVPAPKKGKAV